MAGNYNGVAYNSQTIAGAANDTNLNWGANAKRSLYSVMANQSENTMANRDLLNSRLWHGVPQLTDEQLSMFEAAYTGHTFIFVIKVPAFMTTGYYAGSNMHQQMRNLKAVIERASTGFSGAQNIIAGTADQEDGNGRKVTHITNVTKDQGNISLRLHEFAGLPVKNAIEAWLTGIYDYRSQHGNYHGNLGINGGWCLANHSMSILVVQVTPDWTTIQDAAYYYNMVPTEVPFQHFEWTKGEQTIVDDYDIEFVANEERSPAVMYAAEKYMNNRVLSMVATSVYNSRQFVGLPSGINDLALSGFNGHLSESSKIIDDTQYNMYITNEVPNTTISNSTPGSTFVGAGASSGNGSLSYEKLEDDGVTKVTNRNTTA